MDSDGHQWKMDLDRFAQRVANNPQYKYEGDVGALIRHAVSMWLWALAETDATVAEANRTRGYVIEARGLLEGDVPVATEQQDMGAQLSSTDDDDVLHGGHSSKLDSSWPGISSSCRTFVEKM